jgi:hypothetical protein
VRRYKDLAQVERAFRSLKSIDLKIRPIYHHLEQRVGHVRQGGVPRSPDPRRRHLRDELLQQHSFRLHAIDSGPACLNLR